MSEVLERQVGRVDDLSAAALLASIRAARAVEQAAAARQLDLAARWADLHPPESIHSAASFTVPGCEHEEPLAGRGTPLVAEFCIPELGAVLGISTPAAKRLVGNALELRHRLVRLWAGVQSGTVPAWRARAVAEATSHATPALTPEAAAFVDAQVSAVAGRIGATQLDRLVAETVKRFDLAQPDPTDDPEDGYLHVDPRRATLDKDDVHYAGTMRFEAELDIADALDLDRAIAHGAATLKALGSKASLDVRRSEALGDLARTQTALDLAGGGFEARSARTSTTEATNGSQSTDVNLPAAREVVLHAHFDATFSGDAAVFTKTGRLEEGQRLVLLDQVKDWCADSRTRVTVRPVIDLNTEHSTPAYEPTTRIREAVILRIERACSRGAPAQPDAATWTMRSLSTTAAPPPQRTSHRCAAPTTASRPTRRGTTRQQSPGRTSGPHPTATTSDATPPAHKRSTPHKTIHQAHPGSHDPADHDPAPHPAAHRDGGATGTSSPA